MALSQSALSELLEAFRTGEGVNLIQESVRLVLQELIEAVTLRRSLAAARPDAFTPNLATSLVTLGIVLTQEKRFVEAMQADREAAALYGYLASRWPDAFTGAFERAVRNLMIDFRDLGYDDNAIKNELASLLHFNQG